MYIYTINFGLVNHVIEFPVRGNGNWIKENEKMHTTS